MWNKLVLLLVACQLKANALELSCDFHDSVNISSGYLDQQNNFHHDGTIFTKGSFAVFDYVLENSTIKIEVKPHVRGCICNYKPCIQLCCRESGENCVISDVLSLPLSDGSQKEIDLNSNEFGVLVGLPCKVFFDLEPEESDEDLWIFEVSYCLFISANPC